MNYIDEKSPYIIGRMMARRQLGKNVMENEPTVKEELKIRLDEFKNRLKELKNRSNVGNPVKKMKYMGDESLKETFTKISTQSRKNFGMTKEGIKSAYNKLFK